MAATANDNDASMRLRLLIRSPEETAIAAAALAGLLNGGDVVSLEGDLGAGKTCFTAGVVRALGGTAHVTSPTFVLQKTYDLPGPRLRSVVHYDVYRLADYTELVDIGFEDLDPQSVALVEWGDRFLDDYPRRPLRVSLQVTGEQTRRMMVQLREPGQRQVLLDALRGRIVPDEEPQPEGRHG
jgi:tRNA threonylcarbamoyladenosine biosynthesis protein TsaE